MEEATIKSETNCPTCGGAVEIGKGDGNTHYYIGKNRTGFSSKEIGKMDLVDVIFKQLCQQHMIVWRHEEFRRQTHPKLYRAIIHTAILFSRLEWKEYQENRKPAGILVGGKFHTMEEFSALQNIPKDTVLEMLYF